MENHITDCSPAQEQKQYTELSTVNHQSNFIPYNSNYGYDANKTNQENTLSFHPDEFFTDSPFVKKYFTDNPNITDYTNMEDNFGSTFINIITNSLKDSNNLPCNISETGHKDVNKVEPIDSKNNTFMSENINYENFNLIGEPPSNVSIKTEEPGESIDEMITILVPQDVDMKNVKLEPKDIAESSNLDSNEIIEVDDNEEFYIIQVQDQKLENPNNTVDNTKRRSRTKNPSKTFHQISKCDLCTYATYDKSNLRKHKLIHTDLKPFSCDLCSFTCKLPKYLKQHMVTHLTIRLFPCTICCHKCRNFTELNRHVKRHLRLNNKDSVEELTDLEKSYCVCRDGCKTGTVKKSRREKKNGRKHNQDSP